MAPPLSQGEVFGVERAFQRVVAYEWALDSALGASIFNSLQYILDELQDNTVIDYR